MKVIWITPTDGVSVLTLTKREGSYLEDMQKVVEGYITIIPRRNSNKPNSCGESGFPSCVAYANEEGMLKLPNHFAWSILDRLGFHVSITGICGNVILFSADPETDEEISVSPDFVDLVKKLAELDQY